MIQQLTICHKSILQGRVCFTSSWEEQQESLPLLPNESGHFFFFPVADRITFFGGGIIILSHRCPNLKNVSSCYSFITRLKDVAHYQQSA